MALTKVNTNAFQPGAITVDKISAGVALSGGPKIANVQITDSSWNVLDDTAVNTDGGYILINGTGFESGCTVLFGSTAAPSVTFVNSTVLQVTTPSLTGGSYDVYVTNPDGAVAVKFTGITASGVPVWVTGSTLSNQSVNQAISIQLDATGATSYALQTGSTLPAGVTLAANGLISGTVTGITTNTTYTFTVEAIDDENQNTPRTFSMLVAAYVEVLYLTGDGSIVDISSSNQSLTVSGVTINTSDVYNGNGSLSFSSSGYIELSNTTSVLYAMTMPESSTFVTIDMYIKFTGYGTFITRGNGSDEMTYLAFTYLNGTSYFGSGMRSASSGNGQSLNGQQNPISLNTWYRMGIVSRSSTTQIYINSANVATFGRSYNDKVGNLRIGGSGVYNGFTYGASFLADDIKMYINSRGPY